MKLLDNINKKIYDDENAYKKHWLRSKTLVFNVLIAVFAVLSTHSELLQSYLSDGGYMGLLILIAAVNSYLRTTTTVGLHK